MDIGKGDEMEPYWQQRYRDEGMIWGVEPSPTVYHAISTFNRHNVNNILVVGSGYGRNTKAFSSSFQVDGIELSYDAIQMALMWDENTNFIQGSILDELETNKKYDAIYCYDLLHLFLQHDRKTIILNCVKLLKNNGIMYFTCFSDKDQNYGKGKKIEEGTYEYKANKFSHFFSEEDLIKQFSEHDIVEVGSIKETLQYKDNETKEYLLRYIIVKKL